MRILFDQATPLPIRPYLKGHEVRTAAQQGWDRLKNGELLEAADAEGFEVLLATDKNMRYQQNLAGRKLALVVLERQEWSFIEAYIECVIAAIDAATPGSVAFVEIPLPPKGV